MKRWLKIWLWIGLAALAQSCGGGDSTEAIGLNSDNSSCSFQIEGFLNGNNSRTATTFWQCQALNSSFQFSIFKDGTGLSQNSQSGLTSFTWQQTDCNSLNYRSGNGVADSHIKDIQGSIQSGILSYKDNFGVGVDQPISCILYRTTSTTSSTNTNSTNSSNQNNASSDADADGIPNASDNCPYMANLSQEDINQNGIGDACDGPDADLDGYSDEHDNCLNFYNRDQLDDNHNGIGDACEPRDVFLGAYHQTYASMECGTAFPGQFLLYTAHSYTDTRDGKLITDENSKLELRDLNGNVVIDAQWIDSSSPDFIFNYQSWSCLGESVYQGLNLHCSDSQNQKCNLSFSL